MRERLSAESPGCSPPPAPPPAVGGAPPGGGRGREKGRPWACLCFLRSSESERLSVSVCAACAVSCRLAFGQSFVAPSLLPRAAPHLARGPPPSVTGRSARGPGAWLCLRRRGQLVFAHILPSSVRAPGVPCFSRGLCLFSPSQEAISVLSHKIVHRDLLREVCFALKWFHFLMFKCIVDAERCLGVMKSQVKVPVSAREARMPAPPEHCPSLLPDAWGSLSRSRAPHAWVPSGHLILFQWLVCLTLS